jgi:plastocyanin
MGRGWGLVGLSALAAVAVLLGATTAWAEDQDVMMRGFAFSPAEVDIEVGDTVTWQNFDAAPHTATAKNGEFRSERLSTGGTFSHTFNAPGEFAYYCEVHPSMEGVVRVADQAEPPPTTETTAPPQQPSPTQPPQEPPPETTAPPATDAPERSARPASGADAQAVTSTTSTSAGEGSPSDSVASLPTTSTTELAAAPAGSGGGSGGVIAVILTVVTLAAAAGAIGWLRLRTRRSDVAG